MSTQTDKKIEALTEEIKELRKMLAFGKGTRDNLPKMVLKGSDMVLKDIASHPGTARKDIAERVKLPPLQVTKIVGELSSQEKLVKVGERRTTRWFTPESLQQLTSAAKSSR